MRFLHIILIVGAIHSLPALAQSFDTPRKIAGYKGIWFDLGQRTEFGSKYSGGLGTYTAKHHPLAIHVPSQKKTFFVYGGTTDEKERHLLAMISYYDHATGTLPQPTVVHDKKTVNDPHDNPSLSIDSDGYLYVFVSGRGRHRPGYKYRSKKPYDINAFELISEDEFTYPQPVHVPGQGFLLNFTKYTKGRELYWHTSKDGRTWTDDQKLAGMGGHYSMTNHLDGRIIIAFNYHPGGVVDKRTNLYFIQTTDMGKTWHTIDGKSIQTPLSSVINDALVHNYQSEKRNVYLKDLGFDADGRPVLLYITSDGHQPGPHKRIRRWTIAHWQDSKWRILDFADASHNYDHGSIYIESDGTWRIIAPLRTGPFVHGTGGEISMIVSSDSGLTWKTVADLTNRSPRNHGYVRRPIDAHEDFYGLWADGNSERISRSYLYFVNRSGGKIMRLPYDMTEESSRPTKFK